MGGGQDFFHNFKQLTHTGEASFALFSPHFYRVYYLAPKESKIMDGLKSFAPPPNDASEIFRPPFATRLKFFAPPFDQNIRSVHNSHLLH